MYSPKTIELKYLIFKGKEENILSLLKTAENHDEAEEFVSIILKDKKTSLVLIENTLEVFLKSRKNNNPMHGYWVFSLSKFINFLWQKRLDKWIKTFYEVAFKGAIELDDHDYSERLVECFAYMANWDDDPKDFHITPENISWINWDHLHQQRIKERVQRKFDTEEEFLLWRLDEIKQNTMPYSQIELKELSDSIHERIRELKKY